MATKKASSGNKKVYLIAGAILLGVAGYFGYNWWKKRKDAKDTGSGGGSTDTNVGSGSTDTNVGSGSGSGSVSASTTTTTSNPFKTPEEVLKFQQWVINTKKDKTILGTGGSTGYGDDGKWGSKSANAWDKYGKEYLTGTNSGSGSGTKVYANLEKDISTIISNQNNSGQKAEKTYLRSVALKYPEFVQNWADAVRKRYDSNGKKGTTFIFANEIYDSFQAEKLASKYILGKTAYKKDGSVYAFEEASRYSSNVNLSGLSKERGVVKGYFFNKDQRILWLYIPQSNGSSYVWYSLSAIDKFV
jgi:hypothetical protein